MKDNAISYRLAVPADCDQIAMIHTLNWKRHYRGLVPDHYLDHEVEADRLKVWRKRFQQNDPKQHTVVAETESKEMIGFVCSFLDYHVEYGTYLDNLHVLMDYQGMGIGKELMKLAGVYVEAHRPGTSIYLHVLKGNLAATKFYEGINGKRIREYIEKFPWLGEGLVVDFLWAAKDLAEIPSTSSS